ncbi:MAG: magnesium transporter [bacterium]|nr:magnesium transporter [bacterium]
MRFRVPGPRRVAETLREFARRRPVEAAEYIETHRDEWEALVEESPETAADVLEAIDEESAAGLLTDLEFHDAGEVLDEMSAESAADVLEELNPATAADLIEEMTADQAADLIGALEEDEREAVLASLEPGPAAEIAALLQYAPDSAGGLMTTEVASLPTGLTAGEAIEALRRLHGEFGNNLYYVYVTDYTQKLAGVVSFRDLVFARPGAGLDEVMIAEPYSVHTDTDREELAELIDRHNLLAIPVVNTEGRLVGMVTVGEAMRAVQAEATEDITQMVGAGAEESVYTPILRSVRRRLPWLLVNLVIGVLIAIALGPFEKIIANTPKLAVLMPMVALLGGNSGAQSLAVIIRAMALGDLPRGRAMRAVRREFLVGITNAAALTLLAGVTGGLFARDLRVGIVMGFAVGLNLIVAGAAGAGIPVILRRLGLDPALASNIFLTLVTDIVGFAGFLFTAQLLL